MDLPIGGKISLKPEEGHGQVEGVLVGTDAPHFIIVRLTQSVDNIRISEGQDYSASYMHLGAVYRVHHSVLAYLKKLNLAILSYPVTYEKEELRKEPQNQLLHTGNGEHQKNALKGLITDISNHGCQFIVKIPATIKLNRISVLTEINLSLAMLGEADQTRLKGKVRNTNIDEFKIALGIEFEKMEEQISHRLNRFIENLMVVQ